MKLNNPVIKSFILAGVILLFNVLIADDVSAQLKMPDDLTSETSYSNSNVYLFPVNPGKANFLAGTM
ncbi:MAG: hypothetical protein ACKO96_07375, partial [Flammeovirgaceae bacterium]